MKIYLCDLTHVHGQNIATESIPLNIGLIKSYLLLKDPSLSVELFKYPEDLKAALASSPSPIYWASATTLGILI